MNLPDWISWLIIFVSLLLSAFFSASETAMTASSRARLGRLEKHGNAKAGLVRRLLDNRERMVGAMLVGNNIANIGASALTTGLLLAWFGDVGVLYATFVMSIVVIVATTPMVSVLVTAAR